MPFQNISVFSFRCCVRGWWGSDRSGTVWYVWYSVVFLISCQLNIRHIPTDSGTNLHIRGLSLCTICVDLRFCCLLFSWLFLEHVSSIWATYKWYIDMQWQIHLYFSCICSFLCMLMAKLFVLLICFNNYFFIISFQSYFRSE